MTTPAVHAARLPLSVLIIARDEELNLADCLHSVCGWAGQVAVVVDPRTTDRTREIARAAGCDVVERAFDGFARQREWAIRSGVLRHDWIFILDADERVAPRLRREIAGVLADPRPLAAYAVRFRFVFYGRWIKHGWYGTWIIRMFHRDRARYELRDVHEHIAVDGATGYLTGDLIHNDFKDMDAWIAKHNRYATLEAREILRASGHGQMAGRFFGTRVERRRFVKERIWNRIPFRPVWLFVYLYIAKLGFLNGSLGFRFCAMHAVFDALTTAKVWESRWLARYPAGNYYRELLEKELAERPDESSLYPG